MQMPSSRDQHPDTGAVASVAIVQQRSELQCFPLTTSSRSASAGFMIK